ncbi:hypothetical protein QP090_26625 [Actinomadura xylanilytica]|nr:hypothetical protein [Actinomadura xylanilytica]MDL4775745.1 hypothetical protein [Actinomadura xylanilytica]
MDLIGLTVVTHFQAERVEQPAERGLGHLRKVDAPGGQPVEKVRALPGRTSPLQLDEAGLLLLALGAELGRSDVDVAGELWVRRFEMLQAADQALPPRGDVVDGLADRFHGRPMLDDGVFVGVREQGGQTGAASPSEHLTVEELRQPLEQQVLANPVAARMALGDVPLGRTADVVLGAHPIVAAEKATTAAHAYEVGAQNVRTPSARTHVAPRRASRAFAAAGDLLCGGEDLHRHQRLVGGHRRPDPRLGRIVLAAVSLGSSAVPHHVAGVLRIDQNLADRRMRPPADRPFRVDRLRRRVAVQVGVETVGDRLIAQALADPPSVDRRDDRPAHRVRSQGVLGRPLGPPGRNRMRDLLGEMAVRRFSDVVALLGVGLEPTPGLLQQLQHVPLGDALLDPPREDLRGALAIQDDGLVRCQKQHARLFEFVLDESADVGTAGDAVDRFADHRIEAPV